MDHQHAYSGIHSQYRHHSSNNIHYDELNASKRNLKINEINFSIIKNENIFPVAQEQIKLLGSQKTKSNLFLNRKNGQKEINACFFDLNSLSQLLNQFEIRLLLNSPVYTRDMYFLKFLLNILKK